MLSLLRLLNVQGIAGVAVGLALGILLLVQKGESRHWKKSSGQFEQLYHEQQSALATTVADYRAAAETARASDHANAERVAAEQRAINERTSNDFESRLSAARALAQRLRGQNANAAGDPRSGGNPPVPGLPASLGGPAQAAGQDRLPDPDRLIATEQAIQLDELIKWVKAQGQVDNNAVGAASR